MNIFLNLTQKNELRHSIPMEKTISVMEILSQNGYVHLPSRTALLVIDQGAGPLHITNKDSQSHLVDDASVLVIIPPGERLTLISNAHPDKAWTIVTTLSGQTRCVPGQLPQDQTIPHPLSQGIAALKPSLPPEQQALLDQALDWLDNGQVGESSKAIVENLILHAIAPQVCPNPSTMAPADADDWTRVLGVFEAIPWLQEQDRWKQMANVSPQWAQCVAQADENIAKAQELLAKRAQQPAQTVDFGVVPMPSRPSMRFS